jgi:hypothetical protein
MSFFHDLSVFESLLFSGSRKDLKGILSLGEFLSSGSQVMIVNEQYEISKSC